MMGSPTGNRKFTIYCFRVLGCVEYVSVGACISSPLALRASLSTERSTTEEASFAAKFIAYRLPCAFRFYVSSASQVAVHVVYRRKQHIFQPFPNCLYACFFSSRGLCYTRVSQHNQTSVLPCTASLVFFFIA